MWVILPQYFPYGISTFTGWFVKGVTRLIHRIEYTTMYGLKTITYIRKSTRDNDRHRVVYVGCLHLVLDVDVYDSVFSIQHSSLYHYYMMTYGHIQ